MHELSEIEIDNVSGGLMAVDGGATILVMIAFAPVGFAMGFGVAVAAGLFYAAYRLDAPY